MKNEIKDNRISFRIKTSTKNKLLQYVKDNDTTLSKLITSNLETFNCVDNSLNNSCGNKSKDVEN